MGLLEDRTLLAYTTVVDTGPSANRVDIVFLGDGYTASEIDSAYGNHIDAMLDHLFRDGEDPYPRYENFFNVHRVDVISNESGADKAPENIFVDTALDAGYYCADIERLICISTSKANDILATELAAAPFTAEVKYVTVNDTKYGGSGGSYAVYAGGNSAATEVALHESGHSFNGLADEYGGDAGVYSGSEPSEVNVTKSPTGDKWAHWLGYDQPGIGVIGAYEGARYFDQGLYRPSLNSKMRSLNRPFDAVSREKIILDIYQHVDPLDGWRDNSSTILQSDPSLWVDVIDSEVIDVEWYVDGVLVAGADGETFRLSDSGYGTGTYSVEARAFDPTDWVRRDRQNLEQTISWQVTVDSLSPTVTVEIADALLNDSDRSSNVTFTFSEETTNFSESDITVANGTLSAFVGSGASYSAIFTADDDVDGPGTVAVSPGSYTDNAGNAGAGGSDTVTVNTISPAMISLNGFPSSYEIVRDNDDLVVRQSGVEFFRKLASVVPKLVLVGSNSGDRVTVLNTGTPVSTPIEFTGNQGFDRFNGAAGTGPMTLMGGPGNDTLTGGAMRDQILGQDGADVIFGLNGGDLISGNSGTDRLFGGNGYDTISGGLGNDFLRGGGGRDQLTGEAGQDEIHGDDERDTIEGGDGSDTLTGGQGPDLIHGRSGNDRIDGSSGNDVLFGEQGADTVFGGTGNDTIDGGGHNDTVFGNDGRDSITGNFGNDRLFGNDSNDTIAAGPGDDFVRGGRGADRLLGAEGRDEIIGDQDADTLTGGDGDDSFFGGDGADRVFAGLGNDFVDGGPGNDLLSGDAGNDTITGAAGGDLVRGGHGADVLIGGTDDDTILGGDGDDTVFAGSGRDSVSGNAGNDRLFGNNGYDTVAGGLGNDFVRGGRGNDLLSGDAGRDELFGDQHNDTLNGGNDNDTLTGGSGSDLADGKTGADTIDVQEAPLPDGIDSVIGSSIADTVFKDPADLLI